MAENTVEILTVDQLISPGAASRTARFVGEDHGAGASFFFVDNSPGQGVGLHWHPYSETWIVLEGEATFRLGDASGDAVDERIDEVQAGQGTIVTVLPERHHGFTNTGDGRLRMLCVHASPRIIQFDLP